MRMWNQIDHAGTEGTEFGEAIKEEAGIPGAHYCRNSRIS